MKARAALSQPLRPQTGDGALLTHQDLSGPLRASTPLLCGESCRDCCRGYIDMANQQGLLPSRAQAMKLPSRSRDAGIGRPPSDCIGGGYARWRIRRGRLGGRVGWKVASRTDNAPCNSTAWLVKKAPDRGVHGGDGHLPRFSRFSSRGHCLFRTRRLLSLKCIP